MPAKHKAWGGLDLSSSQDLTAFVLAIPYEDRVRLLARFWIPKDTLVEKERKDRFPYSQYVRAGWVVACPGRTIDYAMVRAGIRRDVEAFDVQELYYDPHNAAETAGRLQDDDGILMVEHRQGYVSMSEKCKIFERYILEGRIEHNKNPLLTWCAHNVSIKTDDNGNIRPIKPKPGSTKRIDGIPAAIMAVGGAPLQGGEKRSVYEDEGLLVM